jgi:hypothetical protein
MGCPCKLTAAFMSLPQINAPVTARMHREMGGGVYSREDWLAHFDEEDTIVVPLLRQYGFHADADRMTREHNYYRRQPYWNFVDLQNHGVWEDTVIPKLAAAMGIDLPALVADAEAS